MKYTLLLENMTSHQAKKMIEMADQLNKEFERLKDDQTQELEKPEIILDVDKEAASEQWEEMPTNQLQKHIDMAAQEEFDRTGIPWDERIHANSKKRNANGAWKKKRGISDELFDEVVAELKGDNCTSTEHQLSDVSSPDPEEVEQVVAQPVPQSIGRNFQGLMQQINKLFAAQKIQPTYPQTIVNRINEGFGSDVSTLPDIADDPQKVDYAWQCLEVDNKDK